MKKRMMLPVLALMLGLLTACTENTAVPDVPETDLPAGTSGRSADFTARRIVSFWICGRPWFRPGSMRRRFCI